MRDNLTVSCSCGEFQGELRASKLKQHNHLVCYCRDCQAFARFVGSADTLDDSGGTEIIQVPCSAFRITKGFDHLACVRLSEGGLHRWYAACCGTPLGNAPGSHLPFVGVIHECLQPRETIERSFGPTTLRAFVGSATGSDRPRSLGMPWGILKFLWLILCAKLRGEGDEHPFFINRKPRVTPRVLSSAERDSLTGAESG